MDGLTQAEARSSDKTLLGAVLKSGVYFQYRCTPVSLRLVIHQQEGSEEWSSGYRFILGGEGMHDNGARQLWLCNFVPFLIILGEKCCFCLF